MNKCRHRHGDFVPRLMGWVCGQCWKILPERPVKYGTNPPGEGGSPRQYIKWQAKVIKSQEGTILSTYLRAAARRITRRSNLSEQDAYQAALQMLRNQGVEFSDPDYDWSRMSAVDMVDEEMSYWDEEPTGQNG